jgi:hypothetical protein
MPPELMAAEDAPFAPDSAEPEPLKNAFKITAAMVVSNMPESRIGFSSFGSFSK